MYERQGVAVRIKLVTEGHQNKPQGSVIWLWRPGRSGGPEKFGNHHSKNNLGADQECWSKTWKQLLMESELVKKMCSVCDL